MSNFPLRRGYKRSPLMALALYMQSSYREVLRCLLEGIQWLAGPSGAIGVTGNSGISQARSRLGWEPLRQLAKPNGKRVQTGNNPSQVAKLPRFLLASSRILEVNACLPTRRGMPHEPKF